MSLLALVRALALLVGLQVSGLSHVAEDALALIDTGHAQHEEQCPADGPCNDCPPGCPQCHCPNAMRSVAPPTGAPFVLLSAASLAAATDNASSAPLSPDLPGLFRPPQTTLVA